MQKKIEQPKYIMSNSELSAAIEKSEQMYFDVYGKLKDDDLKAHVKAHLKALLNEQLNRAKLMRVD